MQGTGAVFRFMLTAAVGFASGCARTAPARTPIPAVPDSPTLARQWIDDVLTRLSLEDRVAQLLIVPVAGGFTNSHAPAARQLEQLVAELHVGGLLVQAGTPIELAVRLNALQQRAPLPLLVAADAAWGTAAILPATDLTGDVRAAGGTVLPTALGLAATGQLLSAQLAARLTAREARALGVHLLLGPVLDATPLGSDGATPAGSFGDDPAEAARFARAWLEGAQSAGAMVALRHFTELRLPASNPVSLAASGGSGSGEPQSAGYNTLLAHADALVLGDLAATLSAAAPAAQAGSGVQPGADGLRRRLRFQGLLLTPPLDREFLAAVPALSPGEAAVRAVLAGADLLLVPTDPRLARDALVAAVRSGRIPYGRIDESVRRILALKLRLGLSAARAVGLDSVASIIASPEHGEVAARLAAASITLARDSLSLVPLDPRRIHRLALVSVAADRRAGKRLYSELRVIYGRGVSCDRLTPFVAESLLDAAVVRAGSAEAVLLAIFSPLEATSAAAEQRAALDSLARRLARRLARVNQRLVVASFGDPAAGEAAAVAGTHILAWQPHGEAAQAALAHALAGTAAIGGRLPLALPRVPAGPAVERPELNFTLRPASPPEVGLDSAMLARVDELMMRGLTGGAAPGAALAIGRHGRLVLLRGYGKLDLRPGFALATDSSLYDLASLTKVVGTTSALAILHDRGLIDLDAPVQRYLPEFGGTPARDAITIRNLMRHDAGLPAYAPLYQTLRGRDDYRRAIAAMELSYQPGTQSVYSDFGPILAGFIIEQITGQTLDVFLQRELFAPLGMRDTGFRPLEWPYGLISLQDGNGQGAPQFLLQRIAPTEVDTSFRFTQVHGEVHDENAWAMGGVAGHAGLFSSARDLATFAQLLLDRGFYGGRRYFDPATIADFTRRQSNISSRAIGWDTPAAGSSAGAYFSRSSYGHTGFTGTSIWVDPERDLFVVLLTNRVNFGRENQKHVALRRALADAVQLAIRDLPVQPRRDDDDM